MQWKPICASTELVLSRWLKEKPLLEDYPRAFFSARQKFGFGQRGKPWQSLAGGVWVSAAFPWKAADYSPELWGMAVAVALSERLERYEVQARIKWPNDLMVGNQKLAGLLPCLVHRGNQILFARVGIGLNVCNRVPDEGIALIDVLRPGQCKTILWSAEVLVALERAMDLINRPELIRVQAKRRFWAKSIRDPKTGESWDIDSLGLDGALLLRQGSRTTKWTRWD